MPREKPPLPADDDRRFIRTCNTCRTLRNWTVARCPNCGHIEFSLPPETTTSQYLF